MGKHSWYTGNLPRCRSIPAPDMDDMEVAARREPKYTDDVHTNARKLCVGRQSRGKAWMGRVEHVGDIPCDRIFAGLLAGHGYHFRA